MPVVINEIQITAVVSEQSNTPRNTAGSAAGNAVPAQQVETIVKLCVEEVMRILKEKEER